MKSVWAQHPYGFGATRPDGELFGTWVDGVDSYSGLSVYGDPPLHTDAPAYASRDRYPHGYEPHTDPHLVAVAEPLPGTASFVLACGFDQEVCQSALLAVGDGAGVDDPRDLAHEVAHVASLVIRRLYWRAVEPRETVVALAEIWAWAAEAGSDFATARARAMTADLFGG